MFRRFSSWLTQLTARRRAPSDAEIARELRDHLALDAEALLADHRVPGTAAHHAARRRFGNLAGTGESVHDVWHWSWLEQLGQDVRHGTRALARSPAYSVAVAVTLALGIGAGAAMFSLSEAFHHPFPFFPERRLLWITQHTSSCGVDCTQASPAAFVALRQHARTFAPVGAERWETTMRSGDGSEMVSGYRISSDAFTLLEAPFALGRGFAAGAGLPGAAKTLVLTYRFWHEHLAASRGVLDSVVTLGGAPFTVVGVLADGVVFPMVADAYAPLVLTAAASSDYGSRSVDLFARLAPGATLAAAAAEAATIEAQIARASPRTDSGWALTARPIAAYHTDDVVIIEQISAIAALLVFLAACMSAANLALSRAAARRNELALRAALGVRRWRLARHLLTEAMLVTLAACGVGALLARWAMHAMRDAIPADYAAFIPGWARLGLDSRTLMLTLATSVLAMLAFAALPALRATRVDLATVLSDGGRASTGGVRGTRTRATLVVLEVSIAIVLLTAAALFTESVRNMMTGDAGVRLDHVVVMHLSPAPRPDRQRRVGLRSPTRRESARDTRRARRRSHEHDSTEQQLLGNRVLDSRSRAGAGRATAQRDRSARDARLRRRGRDAHHRRPDDRAEGRDGCGARGRRQRDARRRDVAGCERARTRRDRRQPSVDGGRRRGERPSRRTRRADELHDVPVGVSDTRASGRSRDLDRRRSARDARRGPAGRGAHRSRGGGRRRSRRCRRCRHGTCRPSG